jgi:hypothetical protein
MKKTPFGDYPWLCLWLIFPVILCSCAIKHAGERVQKYLAADTAAPIWKIEVFMVRVKWMAVMPADELDFVLRPYNVTKTGSLGSTQVLQLSFRANNAEQANVLREQLLATGVVEQVNVTKESN